MRGIFQGIQTALIFSHGERELYTVSPLSRLSTHSALLYWSVSYLRFFPKECWFRWMDYKNEMFTKLASKQEVLNMQLFRTGNGLCYSLFFLWTCFILLMIPSTFLHLCVSIPSSTHISFLSFVLAPRSSTAQRKREGRIKIRFTWKQILSLDANLIKPSAAMRPAWMRFSASWSQISSL